MSDTVIFLIGLFVTGLCFLFVVFTIYEVRRLYAESPNRPETSTGEPHSKDR